jgi:hypothetical protein
MKIMDINDRIKSFAELGDTLRQTLSEGYVRNGRDRSLHENKQLNQTT